ncbi:oxidoreductase [Amycolatopsis tucumanensis]|uniref:Oxidoreductase n=1 Tax=Amycolatopsis tucumanensis TaxID=401106 RepID=A0ABP7H9G5_9PSEU|nr:oxidoreductase [Amycolatopsis tucumanensis]MCF6425468.1 oxidoreductase [Amycolatopsis tucumanensis]
MSYRWLVTGCSGGLGRVLAEAALNRGDQVVATARDPRSLEDLLARHPETCRATALDVTKAGDAAAAAALAEREFGGVDVLVNNAGYGMLGAIEEGTPDEYRPLFETNVFGVIETTRAVLPLLRKAGGGRIVMMSSGAGIAGIAGDGYYNATKFALEGLSEALAQEVAPFGIATIIVEPGPFRTEFLGRSMRVAAAEMPEYAETAGARRRYRADNDGLQAGDPRKAVDVILRAVDAERPPLHLPLGERAYALARTKFAAFLESMDEWEPLALKTAFGDA